jgi:hypothetical protein
VPNGEFLTSEQLEGCFRALGWRWLSGPLPETWILPFRSAERSTVEMIIVDNGQANPNFIGVILPVMKGTQNRDCVQKALALANGVLGLVKICIDNDGDVTAHVCVPRQQGLFRCPMLRHAVEAVLLGAAFIRPILDCCLKDEHCDVEAALRSRLTGGPRS